MPKPDYTDLDELAQLQKMFQPSPKVPRQIKEKDFKVIRRRRKVKLEDAQRIFYLRHRSHDDSNRIWLSYQEISKVLNLPTMTCYNALRKYKRENMKYENLYKTKCGRKPDPNKLSAEI